MQIENVNAVSFSQPDRLWIRKGELARVVGDDGHKYHVHFAASEWNGAIKAMATYIAQACGLRTGEPVQINVGEELVQLAREQALIEDVRNSLTAGVHFGSRHLGDCDKQIMMDLATHSMVPRIANRSDIAVLRTLETWIANDYAYRIVYVFQPDREILAYMIGFGRAFRWNARPRPWQSMLLDWPEAWDISVSAIDRILAIKEHDLRAMADRIPAVWWQASPIQPEEIIDQLLRRQEQLPVLLSATRLRETSIRTFIASGLSPVTIKDGKGQPLPRVIRCS